MEESEAKKIILVTPLRDEIGNLPRLIDAVTSQSIDIYAWVIVQNGSTDGSVEYLNSIRELEGVENFFVIHKDDFGSAYALGNKYSSVVNSGFEYVEELLSKGSLDKPSFIGILDSDCFPNSEYYQKLINFMIDNSIDISSGIGRFLSGKLDGEAKDWVRGNCRLWKYPCFVKAGYVIGPSADALSLAKAVMKGFRCEPLADLYYDCRDMGANSNYEYYGYSNYYRGITLTYAFLKSVNYFRISQYNNGLLFLKGYLRSYFRRDKRIDDQEIINYFSSALNRKLNFLKRRVL